MRACVLVAPRRFELGVLPDPAPEPSQVIVAPQAVGVCGTDFHIFAGHSNYNFDPTGRPVPLEAAPQVLGHEITGRVLAIGRDVADLRPGDRVVLDQGINCRSRARVPLCDYCASGDSHQCEHYAEHGITGLMGGFAELLAVPAVNAVRSEGTLEPCEAALVEPLACVLHTLERTRRASARFRVGADNPARRVRAVVVCGAGPAGLLFVQVLRRELGFDGLLLVSEPVASKRELAVRLGAEVVDPSRQSLTEVVLERTQGRRAELVIEASGAGHVFADLPGCLGKQGTVVMYGTGHGDARLDLFNALQWKEPTLVLSVGASGGFDADGRPTVYRQALRLLEQGRVEVRSLVTHRYAGLDRVPQAFAGDHLQPGYAKGVVECGSGLLAAGTK